MKRTFLDRLVGWFSPTAELRRLKARGQREMLARAYDAAKSFRYDDWTSATKGGPNLEIRGAQTTLRNKGRDAIRNNPYANKALSAIVSNTVGAGINPDIKGRTKLQTKRINEAWKEWAHTTLCDAQGRHDYFGLQALALRSTVEAGEVLARKIQRRDANKIALLESDFIDSSKEDNKNTVQGVELDDKGNVVAYHLYKSHPNERVGELDTIKVPVSELTHIFKQDRIGQLRGVSWFHPVLRQLNDFNEYQQATLISRKVSACFSAFITTNGQDSGLSSANLRAKREQEMTLEPGVVRYLDEGESVVLASPPGVDGYAEYSQQMLRSIAAGLGITYEALTGDYSQVNFSSGRMGALEFRKNVDMWRWSLLIPQFCEPTFKWFLEWAEVTYGISAKDITVEWVPPAWSMIDPTKEYAAMATAVRNGFIAPQDVIREQGFDPIRTVEKFKEWNELIDENKVTFDSDPRNQTKAGQAQTESENKPVEEKEKPSEEEKPNEENDTERDDKVPNRRRKHSRRK